MLDSSLNSCSVHSNQAGQTTVITLKLDSVYHVDAILIMGSHGFSIHGFHLYVGHSSDYQNNVQCSGGPFPGNAVEAWCDLPGQYVSFVRFSNASPVLNDIVLCTFGVISSIDLCQ